MMRRLGLCCLLFCLVSGPVSAGETPGLNFLVRRGDELYDGDRPYRFISVNIPNLLVIEDAYEFSDLNPWRWPNEFEIEDALESVRQMGGRAVRTYVISVYREGSDMGEFVHVRAPGEFNEEGFRALDKVIEVARRKGIRVIIPLVDQHKWWGGIAEYAAFRGKPADAFWSDRQIIDDFKATIRYLVTRKNVYTGVAYRDEPAVFGWETGNEIDAPPEWTREISAYIKQLDPNHLVIDGKSLGDVPVWSLDDANVDVITTHHYPWGDDHDFVRPIRAAHALIQGKRPYFVGEFGFVDTPHIANTLDAVIEDGISGALLWSLRMHRREGGFYWHMEVGTGGNIYKAYHWPGFASGDRYDERRVLGLLREKAFEIQGTPLPPREPPAPPKLLPIEAASAISWQGSAGASAYEVWRKRAGDGEWEEIAEAVSDADVQYAPLFNDETAVPGNEYFYRVVARNESGQSEPSHPVGPVAVNCRTLVDQCRDRSLVESTSGQVSMATENARTVQEDCHRLAMMPGSTVTYRVEGPLSRCRVFSFARNTDAELALAVSADGQDFEALEVIRQASPASQTVYGYLTPVSYETQSLPEGMHYLRIASRPSPADEGESPALPVEIGRVEIEYDRVGQGAAVAAEPSQDAKPAPVNSTVFIYGPQSVDQALATIDEASRRGESRMNVVVNLLVDLTEDLRIKSYGLPRGSGREFQAYDDAMRDELKRALEQVFGRMVEHNMDIFILPHIDPGGEIHQWRNWVDFDPLATYAGSTYGDLMIGTIVEALQASVNENTEIELALSGEMGTSLFRYPENYRQIVRRVRNDADLKQLKIGFSLNHNLVAGENNPTGADDIHLTQRQRQEMQSLIQDCDFIGMSFYRPVSLHPTIDDFVRGIGSFMDELKGHGLTVPTSTPMHFSEVGIGGGHDGEPTSDPAKAVESPWEGTANPNENPWRHDAMQQLRREYHRELVKFLTQQPAPWRVSAAFFWSMGSWDPLGRQRQEFEDPQISKAVEAHNAAVRAAE